MSNINSSQNYFLDTKPHYAILDGLRGAAALMVLWYHVFEGFAFAKGSIVETFNHGHIAVDFFFMLSGFVISYAYDDRWKTPQSSSKKLTIGTFFKRRLIRLHPMLIIGAFIGLITFLIQGGVKWDGSTTPFHWTMIAFVLTLFFIPAYPGAPYDIRGNAEMFPLNGPSWSLFFEYIGNIIYALFIRRLSNKILTLFTILIGLLWTWFVAFDISGYDMIGIGWTLDSANFFGGLLRMLFPFSLGMLLARNFKPVKIKGIFWIATIILFTLFSIPYIPKTANISINGIYELCCIMLVFPILVWLGASGTTKPFTAKICNFLGDISYPLYIVHYPIMYLFYAWLIDNQLYSLKETWLAVILVMIINIALAYACLKLYDEPIRRRLSKLLKA
ncbi:MAG: acyltransferase [Lentimicrobiaceae bacterium]|nr:acyltransferase [Lentimicrobiaceae bacterium]